MSQKNLSGSIAITRLKHVRMKSKGKSGEIQGIFIPIEANKLIEGKPDENGNTAIYMPVRVIYKTEADDKGQNGFIAKSLDKNDYGELSKTDEGKELAKELTPILGSIKDFTDSQNSQQDTAGAAAAGTFEPDDDLPF